MKFLFNLLPALIFLLIFLCRIESAQGRDVILVENLANKESGELLLKVLEEKFNIPKQLITYKSEVTECMQKTEAILQLCMRADGELDIVKIDRFIVQNSLSVFFEKGEK